MQVSSSAVGSSAVGNAGSGTNGQKAKYTFTFTPSTTAISSLSIMFCTTPIPATGSCTTPTGFDASHVASIQSTSLAGSPSLDTTTANPSNSQGICNGGSSTTRTNCVLLKWASGTAQSATAQTIVVGGGASDYITNPTSTGTFFARITTYSDNAYTTTVDTGTTASSTATEISITAKVQEALNFSVGVSNSVAPGSTCTAFSDSGALSIGDPTNGLSSTTAYDGHSYFRISTNGINGTKVYYAADTLKSGSNSIAAAGTTQPTPTTAVASSPGIPQFGLAIDSSDTQSGNGYSFSSLSATAPYTAGNGTITSGGSALFALAPSSVTTPVQIASTGNVITCDTGSVRYLANIATNTPPGIYTTTVDYIAVPTY
ncbi:MAG TPA: hypothetical protein VJR27_01005 [Candidatus Saccharimonadales bacterium]|nr:hypothetical protein [Candidatus Saccharimonadales bacterium]